MVALSRELHEWLCEQHISVVRCRRAHDGCVHITAVPRNRPRMDFFLPTEDTADRSIARIKKALGKAHDRAPIAVETEHSFGALWAGGAERDFSEVAR